MNQCQITSENGMLMVSFPMRVSGFYDMLQAIKSLPYSDRRFDGGRKVWFVDPKHGQRLVDWIQIYTGETVSLPQLRQVSTGPVMKLLEVRYIGACKVRDDGSSVAFGMIGPDWNVIFPETVLREWFDFGEPEAPAAEMTLYQVLGIKKSATADEIRSAFRRMARQWHPDVCKEPNAHEMFIRIQEAHSILSNVNLKARYDAGLQLQAVYEAQLEKHKDLVAKLQLGYRSPLRCGMILVQGIEKVGRIEVEKILAWEDITKNGKTLVTSWAAGAKLPTEAWV